MNKLFIYFYFLFFIYNYFNNNNKLFNKLIYLKMQISKNNKKPEIIVKIITQVGFMCIYSSFSSLIN